jgi:hypothetical protein
VAADSVSGMEIQAMRPVWASTGEQLLTELDVLHSQIASLQTRRLQVMTGIDDIGYAKETAPHGVDYSSS